jgi:hypothetical protein
MAKTSIVDPSYSVQIDSSQLDPKLVFLFKYASNLRRMWPGVRRAFFGAQAEWFASRGQGSWKAHAASTKAWLSRNGGGNGLLSRKGKLKKSLTGPRGEAYYKPTTNSLILGTSNLTSRLHSAGRQYSGPGGNMPARRPIIRNNNPTMARGINTELAAFSRALDEAWRR